MASGLGEFVFKRGQTNKFVGHICLTFFRLATLLIDNSQMKKIN